MNRFHITSPVYYVNSDPHMGHLYTNVACDFLARFHRLRSREVTFSTGTDEHGQKILQSAQRHKMDPREFCDANSDKFVKLFKRANVEYDVFLRTSTPQHRRAVQHLWQELLNRGEIYSGKYSGWYCVSEESYYAEKDVTLGSDGIYRSPLSQPVERLDTDSYFFKLSRWQQPLLDFYRSCPHFIRPRERYNEVVSFVQSGLQDLSISRPNVTWGIPVPNDPKHTVYVWFDALISYLTACGYPDGFAHAWPPTLQILGKDILRFHAVYWPAMLMAAGLELPRGLFVHGWWIMQGDKMSKSTGNVIDPHDLLDNLGVDGTRYALLSSFAFGQDGEYHGDVVKALLNRDLADTFGNLVRRVLVIMHRHFGGKVPTIHRFTAADEKLWHELDQYAPQYEKHIDDMKILQGLKGCVRLAILGNRYLHDMKPWELIKGDFHRACTIIHVISRLLVVLAGYLWPVLPESMERLLRAFNLDILNLKMQDLLSVDLTLRPVLKLDPLFPKLL